MDSLPTRRPAKGPGEFGKYVFAITALAVTLFSASQVYFLWRDSTSLDFQTPGNGTELSRHSSRRLSQRELLSQIAIDLQTAREQQQADRTALHHLLNATASKQQQRAGAALKALATSFSDRQTEQTRRLVEGLEHDVRELKEALRQQQASLQSQQALIKAQGLLLQEQARNVRHVKAQVDLGELLSPSSKQSQLRGNRGRSSSSNSSSYTRFVIKDDRPEDWQQRTFRRQAAYGFVRYSAYRISRSRIAVLGLAALAIHGKQRLTACEWHAHDSTIVHGRLEIDYMGEHHDFLYEVVVMYCQLDRPLTSAGGYLKAQIDMEVSYPYREEATEFLDEPSPPLLYSLQLCSAPFYGTVSPRPITEFLDYHRHVIGMDHAIIYDAGGVTSGIMAALKERGFLESGLVEVTDFREAYSYDVWYNGQGLALIDCIFRSRQTANWVTILDFDEYFDIPPPLTLPSLLSTHPSAPWITFGKTWFNVSYCVPPEGDGNESDIQQGAQGGRIGDEFLVERMQLRWPEYYCVYKEKYAEDMCLDYHGHRKYIVNPRKVIMAQVHVITNPTQGGINVNAHDARIAHFSQLVGGNAPGGTCGLPLPTGWWFKDSHVGVMARRVRRCITNQTMQEDCEIPRLPNSSA